MVAAAVGDERMAQKGGLTVRLEAAEWHDVEALSIGLRLEDHLLHCLGPLNGTGIHVQWVHGVRKDVDRIDAATFDNQSLALAMYEVDGGCV